MPDNIIDYRIDKIIVTYMENMHCRLLNITFNYLYNEYDIINI